MPWLKAVAGTRTRDRSQRAPVANAQLTQGRPKQGVDAGVELRWARGGGGSTVFFEGQRHTAAPKRPTVEGTIDSRVAAPNYYAPESPRTKCVIFSILNLLNKCIIEGFRCVSFRVLCERTVKTRVHPKNGQGPL